MVTALGGPPFDIDRAQIDFTLIGLGGCLFLAAGGICGLVGEHRVGEHHPGEHRRSAAQRPLGPEADNDPA